MPLRMRNRPDGFLEVTYVCDGCGAEDGYQIRDRREYLVGPAGWRFYRAGNQALLACPTCNERKQHTTGGEP